jgi:hypothetical protein
MLTRRSDSFIGASLPRPGPLPRRARAPDSIEVEMRVPGRTTSERPRHRTRSADGGAAATGSPHRVPPGPGARAVAAARGLPAPAPRAPRVVHTGRAPLAAAGRRRGGRRRRRRGLPRRPDQRAPAALAARRGAARSRAGAGRARPGRRGRRPRSGPHHRDTDRDRDRAGGGRARGGRGRAGPRPRTLAAHRGRAAGLAWHSGVVLGSPAERAAWEDYRGRPVDVVHAFAARGSWEDIVSAAGSWATTPTSTACS